MTFCRIALLLHILGVFFIYIGSEEFVGYEEDALPWTLANEDFEGYSKF